MLINQIFFILVSTAVLYCSVSSAEHVRDKSKASNCNFFSVSQSQESSVESNSSKSMRENKVASKEICASSNVVLVSIEKFRKPSSRPLTGTFEGGTALLASGVPEEEAREVFQNSGPNFLVVCKNACSVVGLSSESQTEVADKKTGKMYIPGVGEEISGEAVQNYVNAANEFSGKFNRAMLTLLEAKQKK